MTENATAARVEVSPQRIAHLPGCAHKSPDDNDYSRWGFISTPGAWEQLADTPLTTDTGADLTVERRCLDCLTRAASNYTADGLPRVGTHHPNRTAVKTIWGGDINQGIITFPTDPTRTVNIFSDETSPYPDRRVPGTDRIDYTGQGTEGDQTLTARGNGYLEEARQNLQACRYWHKAADSDFTFERWVLIVARRREWQLDARGNWRRAYVYTLAPVESPDPDDWPPEIRDEAAALTVEDDLPTFPPDPTTLPDAVSRGDAYRDLTARSESTSGQAGITVSRSRYARSAHAREAVLLRSDNRCENPTCHGMACDTTHDGRALLEVDHVRPLADGGPDHPSNMVALCPNCHAAKTRGANKKTLQRSLAQIATRHHAAALGNSRRTPAS